MGARLTSFLSKGFVAFDLGTTNTLIYLKGKGILLDEPSVAILNSETREVVAVGVEAKQLSGRHGPQFETFRPLQNGVISDFEVLSSMMRSFFEKVCSRFSLVRKDFVLAIPAGITSVEKRALNEAAKKAGAGKIYFIEEPVAAALGAGLRIDQTIGHLVVDIGGGTTEVAVVCRFAIACYESLREAGDELDALICQHMRHNHGVEISPTMAESIKMRMGSVSSLNRNLKIWLHAKELSSGLLKEVMITDAEIRESMHTPVMTILAAVRRVIEKAPPNLASDIAQEGILLAGGCAYLRGWRQLFYKELGLHVRTPQDPLRATIKGIGAGIEQFDRYKNIFHS